MIKIAVLGSYSFQKYTEEIEAMHLFENVQLFYINTWDVTDSQITKQIQDVGCQALIMGPINYSRYAPFFQIPCYVVSPSVSDFLLLYKVIQDYEKTAVVFRVPDDLDFSLLEDCLHVTYHKYYYNEIDELDRLLPELKKKGIQSIIGNHYVTKRARQYGLTGYYSYSRTTIEDAVKNTLQLINNLEQEQKHKLEIRYILENAMCGAIYTTGPDARISYVNQTALNMLHKKHEDLLLKPLKQFMPAQMFRTLSEHSVPENDIPYSLCGVDVIGNVIFLQLQDDSQNICLLFENASKILKYESTIRKEMKKKNFQTRYSFKDIIGSDPRLQKAISQAMRFSKSNSTILINAETGSGKEVFAQSIHNYSPRQAYPFVAINCASIPDTLIESELFGYEAGSFTGASSKGKSGLIELANHGTVFLDDVDSLPSSFQAKLLRVMQEREIVRIGGKSPIPVDVRFIAATNRNLKEMVADGSFRNDLYFRINVLHLHIPPLRERPGDIPLLYKHYLHLFHSGLAEQIEKHFSEAFSPAFSYSYPGNIRELISVVERFVSLADFSELDNPTYLRQLVTECLELEDSDTAENPTDSETKNTSPFSFSGSYSEDIASAEHYILQHYLEMHQGNMSQLAEKLNMSRTTLYKKLKNIDLDSF